MRIKLKKIFSIFIVIIFSIHVIAQTGAWNPSGANASFPRTILKSSEIENVRNSLENNEIKRLFANVYTSAALEIPFGTSNSVRLAQSHIAKNAAFVILMNKKYSGGSIIDLPPDESQTLIAKVIFIFESFATDVDRITVANPSIYDSWQWRSKELIDFAIAYDLLRGKGVADSLLVNAKSHLREFAGHLYEESTRLIAPPTYPISFFDVVFNNHAIMTASALGMAAIVINDAVSADVTQQPINWINVAMWNIENIFYLDVKRQSEPGIIAGYAEGPGYLRYGMFNCLPFICAMGNFAPAGSLQYNYKTETRTIPNPSSDTRYDHLFDWIAKIRMPDGRLPAIEDTYVSEFFPELALLGKSKYIWQNSYSHLRTGNSLNLQLTSSNTDLRVNYISSLPTAGTASDSLFQSLPLSGNLVFRSAPDSNAIYMHVTAKNGVARNNSFGHNQADVTSFLIYSKGEVLALDPGYIQYDRRVETGNAQNHNMVLVDGGGPQIGDPQNSNDADGFIENTFGREKLDYGEARTNYSGADINRKFLFVRKKYFLNADFISSDSNHNYTWQMHGYGIEGGSANNEGVFTDNFSNDEGEWTKGSETILVHTAVNGGDAIFSIVVKPHEFAYNSVESHTAMYVMKSSTKNAEFLSMLYPFTSQTLQTTTLHSPLLTALKINDDAYTDIVFTQADTILQMLDSVITALPRNLYSDGKLTFFSMNNLTKGFDQWFIKSGESIIFGETEILSSDTRVDITLEKNSDLLFTGYVSKACSVSLFLERTVLSVTGNNVVSWIQPNQNYVTLVFSGNSYFSINVSTIVPVELVLFRAIIDKNNIQLNWRTATELNNYGFDVERKMSGEDWKKIGFVAGSGNSTEPNEYIFTDIKLSVGKISYRLKTIDTDGSYEYSTEVDAILSLPVSYNLFQNFPNPFNPSTIIKYTLPFESNVKLVVYNIIGEVVKTLVDETVSAGYQEFQFDASNLSSGIYFYTLNAISLDGKQNYQSVKKMSLIK